MKHKVVTIVLAVVAVGLLAGGIAAYHTERGRAWTAHVKAVTYQRAADSARASRVQARYNELNAQCHAGQAAYDSGTVVYKKAHSRPVCDLQLVQ